MMPTTPQLPDDFISGYWAVVAEELCDDWAMNSDDAAVAVTGYREYMKRVEWAVYNDSTTESARCAKLWFDRHIERPKKAEANGMTKSKNGKTPKPTASKRRTADAKFLRDKNPPAA